MDWGVLISAIISILTCSGVIWWLNPKAAKKKPELENDATEAATENTAVTTMKEAIEETKRRRTIQEKYNKEHNITPTTIRKEIREVISNIDLTDNKKIKKQTKKELAKTMEEIEQEMREAAKNLDFERAMQLRDVLFEMKLK